MDGGSSPGRPLTPACFYCRTILKDSGSFRYLHTAVIVSGTMLVFGGNTHNDTSMSHGAKCFSSDFMAYSLGWYNRSIIAGWSHRFF